MFDPSAWVGAAHLSRIQYQIETNRLKVENSRLRNALEDISTYTQEDHMCRTTYTQEAKIAREALGLTE